jgi:GNAT superfamily N-acetyltransferase
VSSVVITIGPADANQLALVRALAQTIWHAHYPGIISVEQIEYMLERGYRPEALAWFLGSADRGLEIAAVDGEPAGFAAWCLTDTPGEAKLDKLYVLPQRQRLGLGRRLIERCDSLAGAAGATTLILNVNKRNVQAIAAYGKHGFAIRESVVVPIGGGFAMDDYVMARAIGRR